MYTHIRTHTHTHTCINTHIHTHSHAHTHTHTGIVRLLRQVDAQIFTGWDTHEVCHHTIYQSFCLDVQFMSTNILPHCWLGRTYIPGYVCPINYMHMYTPLDLLPVNPHEGGERGRVHKSTCLSCVKKIISPHKGAVSPNSTVSINKSTFFLSGGPITKNTLKRIQVA